MTKSHDTASATTPRGSAPSRPRRHLWITWVGIALSVACLYVALRGTDLRQVSRVLSSAHLALALPLLLIQVPFYWFKALRWRLLLAPVRSTPTSPLVAPMMIGFMGNNVLPARIGELIRMYLGARLMRVAQSQVLATLVLERIFDVIAVLVFLALGVVGLKGIPQSLYSAGYVAAAIGAAGVIGAGAYVVWTDAVLRIAERAGAILPATLRRRMLDQLRLGASGMESLRRPSLLLGIIATSFAQWLLMALCVYISFLAVDIDAPLSASLVVLAATVFGVMVPAAPGFFGTLHLSFVLALTPFAVAEGRAMAAAIFYHIIPYAGVTVAGLCFVRQAGLRLTEIENEALEA